MQDKLLIKYIKKKNPKGMDILIENYGGLLTSVVRTHLGILTNYEDECINDVLLSVWESIEGYDKNKNTFKNWICAIAKYKSINYRKKYLSKYEQTEIKDEIYYIDKELIRLEINEDIEEILCYLNSKDKELFIKYYIEGYQLSDIATENKTSVTNLHKRLSRGRKKIKENFKIEGE
ncbi:sigma-70 family RNA polymerase sigma factor [Paraclostridium sordellii]|uniref:sigma-70 family RNA polymerase sigma factor n=1 Tax=Paraclostridium sordellii TaxID=1505 RepID=UPI0005E55784|nr:sigma-70 family RNA polymerase sigma factor [Paeniclostridium sordellii]CEN24393.1 ECF subfamily RNA polymerase sigma-24 subunit [[Clostridium] sordellii] [Paeniclostridium sordellii]